MKEFVKKNKSFGYSGYIEIDGEKYFCRSLTECIYILYYKKIYKKPEYEIKMENKTFYYNEHSYKPDIFIYRNGILSKIIEVKYSKNQFNYIDTVKKYEDFKNYFNKIGIDYEIVFKNNNILKDFEIKDKVEYWKNNEAGINIDLRGDRNPMFGRKQSDDTKIEIGKKTKERCKSEVYLEKFKKSVKKTDEQKINCKNSALKRYEKIRKNKLLLDPLEKRKCVICENEFECNKSSEKKTCRNSCTYKLKFKQGIIKSAIFDRTESYKNKIFNYLILYKKNILELNFNDFAEYINNLKKESKIPITLGIGNNTINKYFGNFENFKKQFKEYESIKNTKKERVQ